MKTLIKTLLKRAGLRLSRSRPENRFQATEDALGQLRARGFAPRVIVDGGANMGDWTRLVQRLFPSARVVMIEPQPDCQPALQAIAGAELQAVAITAPGIHSVRFVVSASERGCTGAHVVEAAEPANADIRIVEVPARSLDEILGELPAESRTLLKLDLEGHELSALQGAERVLSRIEVIFTEIHFYDPDGRGRTVFGALHDFLSQRGFVLHDFASLSHRSRDSRLRQGDLIFVREGSPLLSDMAWQ
jgi:FkbM family methyltransferase